MKKKKKKERCGKHAGEKLCLLIISERHGQLICMFCVVYRSIYYTKRSLKEYWERLVLKKKFRVEYALNILLISEISFGACFKTKAWEALSGLRCSLLLWSFVGCSSEDVYDFPSFTSFGFLLKKKHLMILATVYFSGVVDHNELLL